MTLSELVSFMREAAMQQPTNSPDCVYLHCIISIEKLLLTDELHPDGFVCFWALGDNYSMVSCNGKITAEWVNGLRSHYATYQITKIGKNYNITKL